MDVGHLKVSETHGLLMNISWNMKAQMGWFDISTFYANLSSSDVFSFMIFNIGISWQASTTSGSLLHHHHSYTVNMGVCFNLFPNCLRGIDDHWLLERLKMYPTVTDTLLWQRSRNGGGELWPASHIWCLFTRHGCMPKLRIIYILFWRILSFWHILSWEHWGNYLVGFWWHTSLLLTSELWDEKNGPISLDSMWLWACCWRLPCRLLELWVDGCHLVYTGARLECISGLLWHLHTCSRCWSA